MTEPNEANLPRPPEPGADTADGVITEPLAAWCGG